MVGSTRSPRSAHRKRKARGATRRVSRNCARAADYAPTNPPYGRVIKSEDYVSPVSATTGMPFVLARNNMGKIRGVLAEVGSVLNGLTRNIDWKVLDQGFGEVSGQALSFYPRAESLGVVLPSNSPGVHSLWIPSVPLKIPLALKPGSAEPWTPYRIIQALIKAGAPREDLVSIHRSRRRRRNSTKRGRGMIFGDASSTVPGLDDRASKIHGRVSARSSLGKTASMIGRNIWM